MDGWIGQLINRPRCGLIDTCMEYTKRRHLNRGYMKLEVWQRGMDLFELAFRLAGSALDFKLKSQCIDAAQSVSANVAEGYGRRTLPEYLQFLYIAQGSPGAALTRGWGLLRAKLVPAAAFEEFDILLYEVENKLLALIGSLRSRNARITPGRTRCPAPNNPPIH